MTNENETEYIEPATCQARRYDDSLCGRKIFEDIHCIFHSDYIRAEKRKFNEIFWKEFEKQKKEDNVYDFSGFVFPESINFNEIIFEKDIYFIGSNFLGDASFCRAKFKGNITSFSKANFSGQNTNFNDAEFHGKEASFLHSKFSGENTLFNKTKFFSEAANFNGAEFSGKYTSFILFNFYGKTFKIINAFFRDVYGLFEAIFYKTKFFKIYKYKIKIEDFRIRLGEEAAIRFPLIKRMAQDEWYLSEFKHHHPNIYAVWKLTSDCGRSILRWAVWSLAIAILFAVIFLLIGQDAFEARHQTWFSFFYYSIVTFTTLGFGDITPIKWFTEVLVTLEVILGYIMLGGLISIFANKLARRS